MRLLATIDNSVDRLDRPLFMGNPFTRTYYFVFPTLSRKPILDGSFTSGLSEDPTIKNTFESGDIKTRPRFTTIKQRFTETYRLMTNTDKTTMLAFLQTVQIGAGSFRWTNIQDGITYTVRFEENVVFILQPSRENLWTFNIKLLEV